jgi:hypothetical protein
MYSLMEKVLVKKILNIISCFTTKNKYLQGVNDCLPVVDMEHSDNINSFIAFIKQNIDQFKSLNQNNIHLNWKGYEAKYHSNDLEVK